MTNIMSGQSLVGDQDFQVSLAADEKNTKWVATLVPRRKEVRRMFASIILHVNSAQWLVRQVELVEPKGDRTVIELNNIKINQ
jgi:outer membrane lipoprotein carrier protein